MKISVISPDGQVTYQENIESVSPKDNLSGKTNGASFLKALNTQSVASGLSTVTSYKDIFIEASQKYGVSYELLTAMAQQESGFNPEAVSHSGAMGIMQIMPQTASELGLDNPFDAYDNIMAGAKYISQKLDQYDGDVDLALAAYNAGSTTVEEYGGVPPYGETQSYIKNIRAIMERGADIPYKNYVSKTASREEMEADLKALLVDLPETEEYQPLRNMLAELNYL